MPTLIWKRLAMFEVLNGSFVCLSGATGRKSSQVASLSSLRVLLAGVQTIFTAFQLFDHESSSVNQLLRAALRLRVRLAFIAALCLDADPRLRAEDRACCERERCDAALRPSFFSTSFRARERRAEGLRRE